MWQDPIVVEVRRARLEIEKECEDDFARIYARALEVQKKAAAKLVSRPGHKPRSMGQRCPYPEFYDRILV